MFYMYLLCILDVCVYLFFQFFFYNKIILYLCVSLICDGVFLLKADTWFLGLNVIESQVRQRWTHFFLDIQFKPVYVLFSISHFQPVLRWYAGRCHRR